jgi:hypothetical protein
MTALLKARDWTWGVWNSANDNDSNLHAEEALLKSHFELGREAFPTCGLPVAEAILLKYKPCREYMPFLQPGDGKTINHPEFGSFQARFTPNQGSVYTPVFHLEHRFGRGRFNLWNELGTMFADDFRDIIADTAMGDIRNIGGRKLWYVLGGQEPTITFEIIQWAIIHERPLGHWVGR